MGRWWREWKKNGRDVKRMILEMRNPCVGRGELVKEGEGEEVDVE